MGSQRSQAAVTGSYGWPEWGELASVCPQPHSQNWGLQARGHSSFDLRPSAGRKRMSNTPHLCLGPRTLPGLKLLPGGVRLGPPERHWAVEHVGCVCVCLCVYVHLCIVYVSVCVCTQASTCMCVCVCAGVSMCACVYLCIVHVSVCVCMCICVCRNISVRICVYMFICA